VAFYRQESMKADRVRDGHQSYYTAKDAHKDHPHRSWLLPTKLNWSCSGLPLGYVAVPVLRSIFMKKKKPVVMCREMLVEVDSNQGTMACA
jgi:hypothetical protein